METAPGVNIVRTVSPHIKYLWPVLLLAGANAVSRLAAVKGLPEYTRPPLESKAAQDMSAALLGLRRLGADLALIQTLQYIVTPSSEHPPGERPDKTYEHVLRMIRLDPYFRFAHLLGSGILAYHLGRYSEALSVLQAGMDNDPTFWRYKLYAAGIAYKRMDQMDMVIRTLEESMSYPDCPTMLKNILANLHIKSGNYRRAIGILINIIETSRDGEYIAKAEMKLAELQAKLNGAP